MTPIRGYFDTDMLSSCRCHDESALFKILLRKGGKSLEKGKKKIDCLPTTNLCKP